MCGSPQGISQSGYQLGMSDERSGLIVEIFRLLDSTSAFKTHFLGCAACEQKMDDPTDWLLEVVCLAGECGSITPKEIAPHDGIFD